jgi:hypothetical protein
MRIPHHRPPTIKRPAYFFTNPQDWECPCCDAEIGASGREEVDGTEVNQSFISGIPQGVAVS